LTSYKVSETDHFLTNKTIGTANDISNPSYLLAYLIQLLITDMMMHVSSIALRL